MSFRRKLPPVLLLTAACQVPTDILYQRTYFCDGTAQAETCGTTREGAPMTCYMARQIGAKDFCTERCQEENASAAGPGWRCVDTRARVRTCRPSEGAGACTQPQTNCLRTDGLKDEGVCLPMDTCAANTDCRDPTRPTCLGGLVKAFYGAASGIAVDHFSCLRVGCRKDLASCGPGESCLPTALGPNTESMDICVPNCDENDNCPPNYFCLRKVSGPGSPRLCIPGILGFRCITDMDCLLGNCVDTGDGFRVCANSCDTNDDCARFGDARGSFACAAAPGGRGKYCQNWRTFAGSNCTTDAHCRPHETCVWQSPFFGTRMDTGECRARCGPDRPCVDRGGVPHVCIDLGGTQTCYPGSLHLPCEEDADCFGDLKCLEVNAVADDGPPVRRRRCSARCQSDEECLANRFAGRFTYCNEGACITRVHLGMRCERDFACVEGSCKPSTVSAEEAMQGLKRCAR
jgi:hypothetical protein